MIRINCCNTTSSDSRFRRVNIDCCFQVTHIEGVPDIMWSAHALICICVESTARSRECLTQNRANYRDFDTGEVAEWLKAAVC